MDALRVFIAVDIPPFAREKIAEIQNGFKALKLDVAWVQPGNIHLTLKFLGNVDPRRIVEIKGRLKAVAERSPGFRATLGEVGVFPGADRPRVLWVGLDNPDGRLAALQKSVEEELALAGFPPEPRKFSPHLTFGRIKSPKGKAELRNALDGHLETPSAPIDVSSVKLYKSQLTPKGSIYTVLEEFALAGAGRNEG
ncbi:MAG: RNA 2',3'-cyclic phosphodiesterase [Nitrospinae bacterium]|nr:RNA 2',3'-cyclic phosphodiesterase [Nitrospinota bacterium]